MAATKHKCTKAVKCGGGGGVEQASGLQNYYFFGRKPMICAIPQNICAVLVCGKEFECIMVRMCMNVYWGNNIDNNINT